MPHPLSNPELAASSNRASYAGAGRHHSQLHLSTDQWNPMTPVNPALPLTSKERAPKQPSVLRQLAEVHKRLDAQNQKKRFNTFSTLARSGWSMFIKHFPLFIRVNWQEGRPCASTWLC
jgi:hypothetical protein